MVKEHAVPGALAARLLQACRAYRDRPALDDGAEAFSYAGMQAEAETLADDLRAVGLLPHEPVAVAASNRARDVIAFLGVWLAGGVAAPVHRNAVETSAARTLNKIGARIVVNANPELAAPASLQVAAAVQPLGWKPSPPRRLLEGAGFILFSSGTTGEPKAMVVGHQRFSAKLDQIDGEIGFEDGTRSLLPLQLNFAFAQWGGADHLAAGRHRAFAAAFRSGSFADRSGRRRHRPGAVRADDAARDAGRAG